MMRGWNKTAVATLLASGTVFLLFARESYGITAGTFSDPAFYDCVRIYDRNGDGILSQEERAEVVVLNVSGKSIVSLDGLESFPELRELYCYDNALDSLDVGKNSKLQILDCTNNRLTMLDLTANQELGQLYCRDNPLSEIVMTKGQSLAALEHDAGVPVSNGQGETGETGESNSGGGNSSGNGSSDKETELPGSGSSIDGKKPGNNSEGSSGTVRGSSVAEAPVIADERPVGQAVYQRVSDVCRTDRHEAYLPGYADGTFRPEAGVSRGDLSAILYGLLTDAEKQRLKAAATAVVFPDVEARAWYADAARTMTAAGIIEIKMDGRLEPAAFVTRGELANVLDRFEAGSSGAVDYPDIQGHGARDSIRRVTSRGWMSADGDGKFYPDRPVTRAETAAAINRMLRRSAGSCTAVRPPVTYLDVAPIHWAYSDILEASVSHIPNSEDQEYIIKEKQG